MESDHSEIKVNHNFLLEFLFDRGANTFLIFNHIHNNIYILLLAFNVWSLYEFVLSKHFEKINFPEPNHWYIFTICCHFIVIDITCLS